MLYWAAPNARQGGFRWITPGSLIAVSEGAEATQPFRPELKPVDAYASAILDEVNVS